MLGISDNLTGIIPTKHITLKGRGAVVRAVLEFCLGGFAGVIVLLFVGYLSVVVTEYEPRTPLIAAVEPVLPPMPLQPIDGASLPPTQAASVTLEPISNEAP